MELRSIDDLRRTATVADTVQTVAPQRTMSRRERLERWAEVLERGPTKLNSLSGTEYLRGEAQARLRAALSPLSVALRDPVLREAGLRDDTYGEARQFFGLTHDQMHRIVCYCYHGRTLSSKTAARHVRSAIPRPPLRTVLARVWQAVIGSEVTAR